MTFVSVSLPIVNNPAPVDNPTSHLAKVVASMKQLLEGVPVPGGSTLQAIVMQVRADWKFQRALWPGQKSEFFLGWNKLCISIGR